MEKIEVTPQPDHSQFEFYRCTRRSGIGYGWIGVWPQASLLQSDFKGAIQEHQDTPQRVQGTLPGVQGTFEGVQGVLRGVQGAFRGAQGAFDGV